MCPPAFLPGLAADRVWPGPAPPLDRRRAQREWEALAAAVEAHVAPVLALDPEPWAPALTYTRDLSLSGPDVLVPLAPLGPRGALEPPLLAKALRSLGPPAVDRPASLRLDGGNIVPTGDGRLLVGLTAEPCDAERADLDRLRILTGRDLVGVPLAGGRFPHLDMALCDLGGRGWLAYPDALPGFSTDDPAWQDVFAGCPVVEVGQEDGERLACNVVVAGDVVLGPEMSGPLRRRLEDLGLILVPLVLDELRKGGGGAHCCTLELWR